MTERAMDCERFLELLDELVEDRLDHELRESCRRHASVCTECGAMHAALAHVGDDRERHEPPAGFVSEILRRTGGDPCERAAELLADDRSLSSLDRDLLDGHVRNCDRCRALGRALDALRHDLPALAVRTSPDLAPGVLARVRWMRRGRAVRHRATAWTRRPRFAIEAGYVAAVLTLAVLPTAGLGSRVASASERGEVGRVVQVVPDSLRGAARAGLGTADAASDWFAEKVTHARHKLADGLAGDLVEDAATRNSNRTDGAASSDPAGERHEHD